MLKDILEVALKAAGDVVQSYTQERFPDKSSMAGKRRLLMVMAVGIVIGVAVIVIVVMAT